MNSHKPFNILIVDDDELVHLTAPVEYAKYPDLVFTSVYSGEDAIAEISKSPYKYAVILMDFEMGDGLDGADATIEIKKINPDQIIITYSGDEKRETLKKTLKAGSVEFLEKTISTEKKVAEIRKYCQQYRENFEPTAVGGLSKKDDEALKKVEMIGRSKELINVANEALLYSRYSSNVLIRGETGTGKELIARAIHKNSDRGHKPFVAINCGVLQKNLIESELFGHAKGSFTGAINDKAGKFQQANGGTIFLDEIGDMPSNVQVKLLRVLQEGLIEPIGKMPIEVNVRILAATHVNLEEKVKLGEFREDLFFRLNVVNIQLPPLRERKKDIKTLSQFFAAQKPFNKEITRTALEILENYDWPGNIRQLKNVIERLSIISDSENSNLIKPEYINKDVLKDYNSPSNNFSSKNLKSLRELNERIFSLEKNFWETQIQNIPNIVQLASINKISKATLYRKLGNLGVEYKTI